MIINKKILVEFLKKIKLQGDNTINDIKFNFTDDGLRIKEVDITQTIMIDTILYKSAFKEYEAIGEIGIRNISNLINIIDKFNEDIIINTEKNIIIIKECNKKVEFEKLDLNFLNEAPNIEDLGFKNKIKINISLLKDFISGALINTNFNLKFNCDVNKKTLTITNSGNYRFTQVINIDDGIIEDSIVGMGQPFISSVMSLNNDIYLYMINNKPMKIIEKTNHSEIMIFVAPRDFE